jgi:hypothetical protein
LTRAADAPGFATFAIAFGLLLWIGFSRRIIVPGEVSDLKVRMAHIEASEAACQLRCADLEKRILALETENLHLIKGAP